ncbi:MFS transporter [Cronobacter sakazakii]|uniref:MFS transporter n=1 Tax=Cronobacter sakazakii TaxID=28141 RepID=UPI000CFA862C|nr:MFS transporter [Cronobacter sakazakii]ELQ6064214.1 MFS transporter [Cronobacter sakazakii]ELY2471520.1 MFS transporter [Cronobacter sakazakii]ELY2810213.1 MFS transporter [Cronobacter sakazakii]ELY3413187.1 MFS transporter [Cronobacter sakazakii]ELY4415578.1 MFS transporter [Cronobacter sakazakii]
MPHFYGACAGVRAIQRVGPPPITLQGLLKMTTTTHDDTHPRAYWSGVLAMTLCAFALVASEFMPVSLLTPVSQDLGISEGLAGQGIAISGALAVLTSLFLSRLAGNLNRKTLLLGLTLLMALSGGVIALAPDYLTYMAGRALIGVAIGGFWSLSTATAIRLVPRHQVPRALAIFNGGNALATVIAAPLGSWLGVVIGWRGAFFCLAPIALFAFIWQWRSLPAMPAQGHNARAGGALRQPLVIVGMAACGIFFMGQFALFTYVRPFLETVTRVSVPALSLILLGIGTAGFTGTLLISGALRSGFYRTLIAIPFLMAAIAVALTVVGHSVSLVAALLCGWGLIATAAPVGWWTWVARTLPDNAEAGGGLMVAVVQLSIALGSTLGGFAFDHSGWRSTFFLSAGLLLLAALLTTITSKQDLHPDI